MDFATFGVAEDEHVPGSVMHRYFVAYAQHFGVYDKIKLRSTVTSAELLAGGEWHIKYDVKHDNDNGEEVKPQEVLAKKMVLSTGTTSIPNIPNIKGNEDFEGRAFHFKDLSLHAKDLGETKNVVVLGGSKSAADAVYHNASKGRHVDWVIRGKHLTPGYLCSCLILPKKLAAARPGCSTVTSLL